MSHLKICILLTLLFTIRGEDEVSTTEAPPSTTEGTASSDKPADEEEHTTTTEHAEGKETLNEEKGGEEAPKDAEPSDQEKHEKEASDDEKPATDKVEDPSKAENITKDEDKDEDISEVSSPWDKLPKKCGKNRFDKTKETRIIDGSRAKLGQFPWMARLGSKRSDEVFFDCGGSLISKYYVVSAAHCGDLHDIVRLGENLLHSNPDCDDNGDCAPEYQDITVSRVIFQDYCRDEFKNDLMLVELETPATFNDYVRPICLPRDPVDHETMLNQSTTTAGFGVINSFGVDPEQLMYVINPVIDSRECKLLFGMTLGDDQFCIGTPKYVPSNGTCSGDSGGPVMKEMEVNGEMKMHLVGAVSYGSRKCEFGPAVSTDVTYFGEWIVNKIEKY